MKRDLTKLHSIQFRPRYLLDNTKTTRADKKMHNGWTMVLAFSRVWCVRPFFRMFEALEFDRSQCHLLIYNNTNDAFLDKALQKYAKRYQQMHRSRTGSHKLHPRFASVRHFKSFRKYGGLVFGQKLDFDKSKLPAIWDMYKDITSMITTKKFFMLEDDTLAPPHAVERIFRRLERSKKIGLVSGVETTRSPRITDKVRLGTYKLLWDGNMMRERVSMDPKLTGFQECDACGVYCFAAKTKAWRKAWEIWTSEFETHKTTEPSWAPDVLCTNAVKKAGYKIFADFDTPCLHMQTMGDKIYEWAIDRAVVMLDIWLDKYKTYARGVEL